MCWKLQRRRRSKGWYYEAVWRRAGDVGLAASLGYLEDDSLAAVRSRLVQAPSPHHLVRRFSDDANDQVPTRTSIKNALRHWVNDDAAEVLESVLENWEKTEAARLESRGDYGNMRLRDFYDRMWLPKRREEAPATAERGKCRWRKVLDVLGDIRIVSLNRVRLSAVTLCQGYRC